MDDAQADRDALIARLQDANEQLVRASLRSQELAEQADHARERMAFLNEATELLGVSLDTDQTLATVARLAVPRFADWCVIDLIEDVGAAHRVHLAQVDPGRVALAEEARRFPPRVAFGGPSEQALSTGQTIFIPEYSEEMLARSAQDPDHAGIMQAIKPRSVVVAPLLLPAGRRLGVLTLLFTEESGRQYRAEDVGLALELARRCAFAVENARLYRRAEESNRLKDEFLAMLSHELRTPLNAILGWTGLLRAGIVPEESRQRAFDTIERNARAQAQLIGDLLDVSRIVTGKLRLNVQLTDLVPLTAAALDVVRPAADAKGIALVAVLDRRASAIVRGDPDRLQQVLGNLLSNAVKFTPTGGCITVEARRDGPGVTLTIHDTGQGISGEFLPHVFDAFRQAEAGYTRPHGGLGLGLAIVRQLVELHGGRVDVASPGAGAGTTFTVWLPVTGSAAEVSKGGGEDHASAELSGADRSRLAGARVLVVEDDPDSRDLLAVVLRRSGATVTAVGTAGEAMRALGQQDSDAIVADIGLPDRDGYSLIRQIRLLEREHDGRRLPAIAVTAHAGSSDRQNALTAGYDEHLGKPVDPERVAAALCAILDVAGSSRPSVYR